MGQELTLEYSAQAYTIMLFNMRRYTLLLLNIWKKTTLSIQKWSDFFNLEILTSDYPKICKLTFQCKQTSVQSLQLKI